MLIVAVEVASDCRMDEKEEQNWFKNFEKRLQKSRQICPRKCGNDISSSLKFWLDRKF